MAEPATPPSRPPTHTLLGLPTPPTTPAPARVPSSPQPAASLAGRELLGRYAVEAKIGEGGMGVVYRGRHLTLGSPVAIKVLRPEFSGRPDAVDRFLQEARAASRVRQPNVVEITDFGTTPDGVVFFVMELLEGETLLDTVRAHGPLSWTRARNILRQICAALQAAHDAGIVHRDLKPDNCLRISRGPEHDFVKVLDFGIAKVGANADEGVALRRTRVGLVVGTPQYMAPEHARGEEIDHRIDVYAAGVILYELVTGVLPFDADSVAEIVAMHLREPVPDPRARRPELSPAVGAIVAKAMAKNPDDRYATMQALADAIDEVPSAAVPVVPAARRRRGWLALAGVVGCAIVAVALGSRVGQHPLALHVPRNVRSVDAEESTAAARDLAKAQTTVPKLREEVGPRSTFVQTSTGPIMGSTDIESVAAEPISDPSTHEPTPTQRPSRDGSRHPKTEHKSRRTKFRTSNNGDSVVDHPSANSARISEIKDPFAGT